MKICIADKNIEKSMAKKLEDLGFLIIYSKKIKTMTGPLSTHPDIQICKINDKLFIAEESVFKYYENKLSKYGIIIKSGKSILDDKYPNDSFYNAAIKENIAIHNFKITDEEVLNNINVEKINVKQGYSKCNTLFTKTGIITSDKGIYKKIKNMRKLLISPGYIDLEGYDYGFIGGASGYFDKIYFLGNIYNHPDFEKINRFLKEEDTDFEILSEDNLKDYGSLIFINTKGEIIWVI